MKFLVVFFSLAGGAGNGTLSPSDYSNGHHCVDQHQQKQQNDRAVLGTVALATGLAGLGSYIMFDE